MIKKLFLMWVAFAALPACMGMPVDQDKAASVALAAERLRIVMVDPDRAKLEALVAQDLNYGHSSGKIETKTKFIDDLMNGSSDFLTIDIRNQTVSVVQDVAIIRHTLIGTLKGPDKVIDLNLNILQIWQQQEGYWKLLARQAMRPPQ